MFFPASNGIVPILLNHQVMLTQHTKLSPSLETNISFSGMNYTNGLAFLFAIFYFANYWPFGNTQPVLLWISSSLLLLLMIAVAGQLPLFWAIEDKLLKGLVVGWLFVVIIMLALVSREGWPLQEQSQFILGSSTALLPLRYLQLKKTKSRVTLCLVAATLVGWIVNSIVGVVAGQLMWSSRVLGGFLWLTIGITVAALVLFLPPSKNPSTKRKKLKDEPIFEELSLYQDWLLLALFILQMSLSLYTFQIEGSHHSYYSLQVLGMAALLASTAGLALHFEQQSPKPTS